MTCLGVEYSYDPGYEEFLGESSRRRHRLHRNLRTYQPFTASLPKPMTKDEIEELVQESIAARLSSIETNSITQINNLGRALKEQAKLDRANINNQLNAFDKTAEMNAIRERLDITRCEVSAIDKTATAARLTAESLRQSVIDQQKVVNDSKHTVGNLVESSRSHGSSLAELHSVAANLTKNVGRLDSAQAALGIAQADLDMAVGAIDEDDTRAITERLESTDARLGHLQETLRKLEMSYVEEEGPQPDTAAAAPGTAPTPALAEVAKTVGGAIGTGIALGASAQFISEVTELAVAKALKAGMITPALGESIVFKEALKLCIPILMLAASQYPACPKREFFGKVGDLAVRGQSAQHAAMATAFAMSFVSDMMALPSASGLGDQLSAAQ